MTDIYVGLAILAAATVFIFVAVVRITRSWSRRSCDLAAVAIVLAMFAYIRLAWYAVWVAEWLPVSNLIVVGNWLPLFAGLLGAIVWRRLGVENRRRGLVLAALGITAGYSALHPLLGETPRCDNLWTRDGVCIQSNRTSCTAAAAATLLTVHGIQTNEQEMADLCLTRDGTTWLGLFRGLKLKTQGTPWDVQVVACDARNLREFEGPVVLRVGLDASTNADVAYQTEYGWTPGVTHSVVLFGFEADRYALIGDPTPGIGRERWTTDELAVLWRGQGMCLVPRDGRR